MAISLIILVISSAIIYEPSQIRDEFQNRYSGGKLPHTLGGFRNPPYGSTLIGDLQFQQANPDGCLDFLLVRNPEQGSAINSVILLAQRENCKYVTKTSNAQVGGARLLIVIDNREEMTEDVNIIDDGSTGKLDIPTVMIRKLMWSI